MNRRRWLGVLLALLSLGSPALGCREIVGVPAGSSLSDISGTPPLCECGPLEQQPGGDVVQACEDAYARLPDFGEGDPGVPFGSKEALLASDCRACDEENPAQVRDCFAQLLESSEPGASPPIGSDGAACSDAGDCGSWACCAGAEGGSCCGGCVGCSQHVSGAGASPLCAEDAELLSAFGACLCDRVLGLGAGGGLLCRDECDRAGAGCLPSSGACVYCLSELPDIAQAECDAQASACQSSGTTRPAGLGG